MRAALQTLSLLACAPLASCLLPSTDIEEQIAGRRPALAGQVVEGRYFGPDALWSVALPDPPRVARWGDYDPWAEPIVIEVPAEPPIQGVRFVPDDLFRSELTVEVAWLPRSDGRASDLASFELVAVRAFEEASASQLGIVPKLLMRAPIEVPAGEGSRWVYLILREGSIIPFTPPARTALLVRDLIEVEQGFFACLAAIDVLTVARIERRDAVEEVLPTALARFGPTLDRVTASLAVHAE